MKSKKMLILLSCLIDIVAFLLFYFHIQKHYAKNKLDEYMNAQGISKENIQSKRIFKDYKVNGYAIQIVYKDDADYTYYYNAGTDHMICIVYDDRNVSADANNKPVKYPSIY